MGEIVAVRFGEVAVGSAHDRPRRELHVVEHAAVGIPYRDGVLVHFGRRNFFVTRRPARSEHRYLRALKECRHARRHHGQGCFAVSGQSKVFAQHLESERRVLRLFA